MVDTADFDFGDTRPVIKVKMQNSLALQNKNKIMYDVYYILICPGRLGEAVGAITEPGPSIVAF